MSDEIYVHLPDRGADGKIGCAWPGCTKRIESPFESGWYFYPGPEGTPGNFGCRIHAEALLEGRIGAIVQVADGELRYIIDVSGKPQA
jgi:hypothetical protein